MISDDPMLLRKWFHAIDFGDGVVTRGRFPPEVPPNYTLFGLFDLLPHIDLSDARCVDVGAMDGLSSFVMARGARGAGARHGPPRPVRVRP